MPSDLPSISPTPDTSQPTENPTEIPSKSPTKSPTFATEIPTKAPTFATVLPTKSPSEQPTKLPTLIKVGRALDTTKMYLDTTMDEGVNNVDILGCIVSKYFWGIVSVLLGFICIFLVICCCMKTKGKNKKENMKKAVEMNRVMPMNSNTDTMATSTSNLPAIPNENDGSTAGTPSNKDIEDMFLPNATVDVQPSAGNTV
eukprot:UN06019